MAIDEYLRRKNLERARRRRFSEAHPTPAVIEKPSHIYRYTAYDRAGPAAEQRECVCDIGHDHEEHR